MSPGRLAPGAKRDPLASKGLVDLPANEVYREWPDLPDLLAQLGHRDLQDQWERLEKLVQQGLRGSLAHPDSRSRH